MSQPASGDSGNALREGPATFEQPAFFSPSDYLLGIVTRIAASGENAHITLPGKGELVVVPEQGAYFSDVPDMAEFCQAPAAAFRVAHPTKDEYARLSSSGAAGHIPELLWEAAFHASQGRLVGSRSNEDAVHLYDVIRFHHWPNLTRVSQTPNTMRICALLTRQPSSILLVARKLGIEPEEVYKVYSAACSYGIVNVISNHLGQADVQASIDDGSTPSGMSHHPGLIRALFSKLAGL